MERDLICLNHLIAKNECGGLNIDGGGDISSVFDKNDIPYVLEINTIPGMTDLSDLPAQAKCMGIEYDELVQYAQKRRGTFGVIKIAPECLFPL